VVGRFTYTSPDGGSFVVGTFLPLLMVVTV
jgi:hypothetical protein